MYVAVNRAQRSSSWQRYPSGSGGAQATRVAVSDDGLNFNPLPQLLGEAYFRVFQWAGWFYALAMPGVFYRSRDGLADFEPGPTLFSDRMRHSAIWLRGETLNIFYTNAGDCPERIMLATIELHPDWSRWAASDPVVVLQPELPHEGGDLPRARRVADLSASRFANSVTPRSSPRRAAHTCSIPD